MITNVVPLDPVNVMGGVLCVIAVSTLTDPTQHAGTDAICLHSSEHAPTIAAILDPIRREVGL